MSGLCTLPQTRSATSPGSSSQSLRSTSAISPVAISRPASTSWFGISGRPKSSIGWPNGQWPDVVQQGGGQQQLGVFRRDGGGESLVGRELIQVFDRRQEHAQRMFLPRVIGGRIDQPHQAQLADLREPAKAGRVDQPPHARRERHVDARRNPHAAARPAPAANFGDVVDGGHDFGFRISDCGFGIPAIRSSTELAEVNPQSAIRNKRVNCAFTLRPQPRHGRQVPPPAAAAR